MEDFKKTDETLEFVLAVAGIFGLVSLLRNYRGKDSNLII